jgi:hypothetical protein
MSEEMRVHLGVTPMYCQCGSTLHQRKTNEGLRTVECMNPRCELTGKTFAMPSFIAEEIKREPVHG